jgi:hypothetical protein
LFLSFTINPKNDNANSNKIKTWNFNAPDNSYKNIQSAVQINIDKTTMSNYILGVSYEKENATQNTIPINAYSYTTGFGDGTNWLPTSITLSKTSDNNKMKYQVNGIIKWKLLGIKIYSQQKSFNGFAVLY